MTTNYYLIQCKHDFRPIRELNLKMNVSKHVFKICKNNMHLLKV